MTNLFTTATGHLRARHRAEWRFRWLGRLAIVFSLGFLLIMLVSIISLGKGALSRTEIQLSIDLSAASTLEDVDLKKTVRTALFTTFPEVIERSDKRALLKLLSADSSYELARMIEDNPALLGQEPVLWFTASDDIDMYEKGAIDANLPENRRRLKDTTLGWVRALESHDALRSVFNTAFFTSGDSREPELAGIFSALIGSILSLIVCFTLSFPLGIMAALSLEEFSKKSRWSDFIEVNINNLAAVPSIVFGLLGMAIFLNVFGLPRSSPLVGGMVLALMTLPTIIIASRAALRSVPPSIREAALAMGATRVQTTFHHVLPLAMPGMLTGAIVGMARALGETAPLIMIGMVAFIVDVPQGFTDAATSLPVQIFLWADSPERAFLEKTSAAILVLLGLLVVMNIAAIVLRRKFERRY
ncbi:MAG: phosphate ABC transporter permease PstA [Rhodobacteraceae bacterium]|nr:phosphate ABC transporter permease PstA [Paracoccaceae bacterium]